MRHGKKFNHLSRTSAHRKAMLANMGCSLIEHKRIKTTLAKAKALRVFVEPLITKSKNDTTHSRRTVFSYLKQKEAITELFSDIATKVADRSGGYTRILKLGNRLGDNAKMAYIELVDYNEDYTTNKPKRKKARRAKKKNIGSENTAIEEAIVVDELEENTKTEKNITKVSDEEIKIEVPSSAGEVRTEKISINEQASAEKVTEKLKIQENSDKKKGLNKNERKDEDSNPDNKEAKGE